MLAFEDDELLTKQGIFGNQLPFTAYQVGECALDK
jgi:hypothetical protein